MYEEPESPKKGVLKIYDEPVSPSEGACLRYTMSRCRQMWWHV